MKLLYLKNPSVNKIIFVFCWTFLLSEISAAQPVTQWAKSIGTSDQEFANAICSDSDGNIYFAGSYYKDLILCDDTLPTVAHYNYEGNMFISKLDSSGNCIWTTTGISPVASINGAPVPQIYDIKYYNGNLFCVGVFYDSLIVENDTLVNSCTALCGSSFVMNLDNAGHLIWIRHLKDTLSFSNANAVAPTNDGVLVAGGYVGVLKVDSVQLIAYRPDDINAYLLKFNLTGDCTWGKTIGITEHGQINDMVYDNDRNIYLAGEYNSILILPSTTLRDTPYINPSTFLAKYDTDGNFIWARGGSSEIKGNIINQRLCINDSGDNIYFTGSFSGTAMFSSTFQTQSDQYFKDIVAKLDTSGTHIWTFSTGNKRRFQEFSSYINSSGPGFILASVFNDTIVVGPDSLFAAGASTDVLLTQYDEDGNVAWNKHFGGQGQEVPHDIFGNNGSLYLCGSTQFDYNIDTIPIAWHGWRDILLAKFKLPAITTGITEYISEPPVELVVFPNPANSYIKVSCNKTIEHIFITNIFGQIIYKDNPNSKNLFVKIDSDGIYFMRLTVNGETITRELIVNH